MHRPTPARPRRTPARRAIPPLLAAAALAALAGCATAPAPQAPAPEETSQAPLGNAGSLVVLDAAARTAVTCSAVLERALADGRLDVAANLTNLASHPVLIRVQCGFQDRLGAAVGGAGPWQELTLAENAVQTVHFTAPSAAAARYTIRIR
jgi:hypothetical protein